MIGLIELQSELKLQCCDRQLTFYNDLIKRAEVYNILYALQCINYNLQS